MDDKAEETQSLSMELDLPHAPAKVWRALTEPALLAKWLMATDLEPVVGNVFKFQAPSSPSWDGTVRCEMQEVDPHRRLRYSWAGGALDSTVVTWTLTPTKAGGTLLRLEHSGFRPQKGQARFFEGAKSGWQWMVGQRLGAVLAEVQ
jgi:uncharacterized protein YndB with AHSA1/START domain